MKPTFRAGPVHVRVPATSANLGPGFDCLGLALGLHDDVVVAVADDGLRVDIAGEGEALPRDESHLVVRAMRAAFERLGGQPRGLELACANRIPHGRGLGSSAAAIVAGIVAARALVAGGAATLPDDEAFALAAGLEGHPDNVAACFHGDLTIAWTGEGRAHAARVSTVEGLLPVALVPPFESSTKTARGLLPELVPHSDAAFSAGRSALLVAALTGAVDADALFAGTEDKLHQDYRAAQAPQTAEVLAAVRAVGVAAVVSGAGPTVLALTRDEVEVEKVRAVSPAGWQCLTLPVDRPGATVVPRGRE